jgi:transposase
MDNLGSHKGKAVRRLIRATGAKLFFLPRYSPDLNPIEQVFAKLKTPIAKIDPPHNRNHLARHRRRSQPLHPTGMRQLAR